MTSNAGSNQNNNLIGFNSDESNEYRVKDSLKEFFRPEFLNRVDEIIVFKQLTPDQLLQIVDLMLEETKSALKEKNITLQISKTAKQYILDKGTDLKYGARPLRRAIQRYIEDEIADMLLKGELLNGNTISISVKDGELKFATKQD